MLKWRNLPSKTDEELRQSIRTIVAIMVTLFVMVVVLLLLGAVRI